MSLRPHLTATFLLGLPLVGTHVSRMLIGVTDTILIGRYGVDELAALVLATSYFFILTMLGSGYALGVMGVIANARARGDAAELRRATRMALWLSVLHSLLIVPLLWWSGPILSALGQEPRVAALGQEWLRVMIPAMPAVLAGMVLNSYLAALGRPNLALLVNLVGLPVNALLNWLLIFGEWGLPELGVRGSGLASLTVNWLQLGALAGCAAWMPEIQIVSLIDRELRGPGAGKAGLTDWLNCRARWQTVRHEGVARIAGTLINGIDSVAVPVLDAQGKLAGAITALGLSSVFDATLEGPASRLLREAGRALSLRLGYHGQAMTAGAAQPKRGRRAKAAPESA